MDPGFARHLAACNNLPSFAGLVPLRLGDRPIGWTTPERARLTGLPRDERGLCAADRETLEAAAVRLGTGGGFRRRGEALDVRATFDGPALARMDRGAMPALGLLAAGAHLNGLVRDADGLRIWVGFRRHDKAVAPGKIDNLAAGGIPAGLDARATLLKEGAEEASLPEALTRAARAVARIRYVMDTPAGVRRDLLNVFDLDLPREFVPRPNDDEVERFELWPAERVLAAVRDTDDVKFNVNLVLIDLFLREGLIDPSSTEGRSLRAGLDAHP